MRQNQSSFCHYWINVFKQENLSFVTPAGATKLVGIDQANQQPNGFGEGEQLSVFKWAWVMRVCVCWDGKCSTSRVLGEKLFEQDGDDDEVHLAPNLSHNMHTSTMSGVFSPTLWNATSWRRKVLPGAQVTLREDGPGVQRGSHQNRCCFSREKSWMKTRVLSDLPSIETTMTREYDSYCCVVVAWSLRKDGWVGLASSHFCGAFGDTI